MTDVAGNNVVSPGPVASFYSLAGDLNRDRVVNFADLLKLAQTYGLSGRTFSEGSVDYSADGLIGFNDLLLLAQRYGKTLVAGDVAAADAVSDTTAAKRRESVASTIIE